MEPSLLTGKHGGDFYSFISDGNNLMALVFVAETLDICVFMVIGLLKKTPEISNDTGANARELLSLKLLESLFIQVARANPESSALSKTVKLDPSYHCEDVLQQILSEVLFSFSFTVHLINLTSTY